MFELIDSCISFDKLQISFLFFKSQIIQDGEDELHIPQRVHLSFQNIDSHGAYILDTSEYIYVYIGKAISDHFIQNVFNVETFSALPFDSVNIVLHKSIFNSIFQYILVFTT